MRFRKSRCWGGQCRVFNMGTTGSIQRPVDSHYDLSATSWSIRGLPLVLKDRSWTSRPPGRRVTVKIQKIAIPTPSERNRDEFLSEPCLLYFGFWTDRYSLYKPWLTIWNRFRMNSLTNSNFSNSYPSALYSVHEPEISEILAPENWSYANLES